MMNWIRVLAWITIAFMSVVGIIRESKIVKEFPGKMEGVE
jgi:hypothetical protein